MVKQAIILCGGKGSRLGNLVAHVPKPMLEFLGRPYLMHLIRQIARMPIDEIILLAGYHGEQIFEKFDGSVINGVSIKVVVESSTRGTLGALINSFDHLHENFLVLNGDTHLNIDFMGLSKFWISNNGSAQACMVTGQVDENRRYGAVKFSGLHITAFSRPSECYGRAYINLGVYIIKKQSLRPWLSIKSELSLERDFFPTLVDERKLLRWDVKDHQFFDFGIPEDYNLFLSFMENNEKIPALFLDRDNTINYDAGYTYKLDDFRICNGVQSYIKKFSRQGYKVFIVSNQSGIGRGYYSEEDVWCFHRKIKSYLADFDIFLDDFYFCPHFVGSDNGKYNFDCGCRKPGIELFRRIEENWCVDIKNSVFIGDSITDELAAKNLGIRFLMCDCKNGNFSLVSCE